MIEISLIDKKFERLEEVLEPQERFVDEDLLKRGIPNLVMPIGNWRDKIVFIKIA